MKNSRKLLLVALVVLLVILAYSGTSKFKGCNDRPKNGCPGKDEFWNCDKCETKVNKFVKLGEPCSFGVHCKPGWCEYQGKYANTYSKNQLLWETTLNGETGTCVKSRPKESY